MAVGLSACGQQAQQTSEMLPAQDITLETLSGEWTAEYVAQSEPAGVTMSVEPDGQFQVMDQCNNPAGSFSVEDGVLALSGEMRTTRMLCDDALMERENAIIDVLGDLQSATLTEDGLLQIAGGNGETLSFQKQ